MNHGLGNIYRIMYDIDWAGKADWANFPEYYVYGDKHVSYIHPYSIASTQYDWFATKTAAGLTQAGLSRVNQLIEAFVSASGAQGNIRSRTFGEGARAKEAQSEFLILIKDSIKQPDLAQSVQRYQLVVDQAKVRLNLAVCPMAWLMHVSMILNTISVVGYNNKLKQVIPGMKLGVNKGVNPDIK